MFLFPTDFDAVCANFLHMLRLNLTFCANGFNILDPFGVVRVSSEIQRAALFLAQG